MAALFAVVAALGITEAAGACSIQHDFGLEAFTPCIQTNVTGQHTTCQKAGDFDFTVITDVTLPYETYARNWLYNWGTMGEGDLHFLLGGAVVGANATTQIGVWGSPESQMTTSFWQHEGHRVVIAVSYEAATRDMFVYADGVMLGRKSLDGMNFDIESGSFWLGTQPSGWADADFEGIIHCAMVYEAVTQKRNAPKPMSIAMPDQTNATCVINHRFRPDAGNLGLPCLATDVHGPHSNCQRNSDFDFTIITEVTLPASFSGRNWLYNWGDMDEDDFHFLMGKNGHSGDYKSQVGVWDKSNAQLHPDFDGYANQRVQIAVRYEAKSRNVAVFVNERMVVQKDFNGTIPNFGNRAGNFWLGTKPLSSLWANRPDETDFEGTIHCAMVYEEALSPKQDGICAVDHGFDMDGHAPCLQTNERGQHVSCLRKGDFDFTVITNVTLPSGILHEYGWFTTDLEACSLKYCNDWSDLKLAFCNGNRCDTQSHAQACLDHWDSNGVNENRGLGPRVCMDEAGRGRNWLFNWGAMRNGNLHFLMGGNSPFQSEAQVGVWGSEGGQLTPDFNQYDRQTHSVVIAVTYEAATSEMSVYADDQLIERKDIVGFPFGIESGSFWLGTAPNTLSDRIPETDFQGEIHCAEVYEAAPKRVIAPAPPSAATCGINHRFGHAFSGHPCIATDVPGVHSECQRTGDFDFTVITDVTFPANYSSARNWLYNWGSMKNGDLLFLMGADLQGNGYSRIGVFGQTLNDKAAPSVQPDFSAYAGQRVQIAVRYEAQTGDLAVYVGETVVAQSSMSFGIDSAEFWLGTAPKSLSANQVTEVDFEGTVHCAMVYEEALDLIDPVDGTNTGILVGCFGQDATDREFDVYMGEVDSAEECKNDCMGQGFKYAGLQSGNLCYCSDTFSKLERATGPGCQCPSVVNGTGTGSGSGSGALMTSRRRLATLEGHEVPLTDLAGISHIIAVFDASGVIYQPNGGHRRRMRANFRPICVYKDECCSEDTVECNACRADIPQLDYCRIAGADYPGCELFCAVDASIAGCGKCYKNEANFGCVEECPPGWRYVRKERTWAWNCWERVCEEEYRCGVDDLNMCQMSDQDAAGIYAYRYFKKFGKFPNDGQQTAFEAIMSSDKMALLDYGMREAVGKKQYYVNGAEVIIRSKLINDQLAATLTDLVARQVAVGGSAQIGGMLFSEILGSFLQGAQEAATHQALTTTWSGWFTSWGITILVPAVTFLVKVGARALVDMAGWEHLRVEAVIGLASSVLSGALMGGLSGAAAGPLGALGGALLGVATWSFGQAITAIVNARQGPLDNWAYLETGYVGGNGNDQIWFYSYSPSDQLRWIAYWTRKFGSYEGGMEDSLSVISAGQDQAGSFQLQIKSWGSNFGFFKYVHYGDLIHVSKESANQVCALHCRGNLHGGDAAGICVRDSGKLN